MTTNEDLLLASPEPDQRWRFDLVLPLFVRPRKTLERIAAHTKAIWRTPILLLLLAVIIHALVAGNINAKAKAGGELVLPPGYEYYTPEQQAQYQQAATATNNPTFNYILPALGATIGLLFIWLALSWLLHLILTLLGGRGTSQSATNIVAWASLPLLIRFIVQIAAMLATDRLVSGQGLSGFAPSGEGFLYGLLGSLLGQVDLFLIWQMVLVIIGMRFSSQLPTAKVVFAVLLAFVIVMALRALPSAIMAQFSDLTVIQPFF